MSTQIQVSWVQFEVPDPTPMLKGSPPGTNLNPLQGPDVGPPTWCCPTCCGERCCDPVGTQPDVYRDPTAVNRETPRTPEGYKSTFSRNALSQTTALMNRWRERVQPAVPGATGGPGDLNLSSGNLVV